MEEEATLPTFQSVGRTDPQNHGGFCADSSSVSEHSAALLATQVCRQGMNKT